MAKFCPECGKQMSDNAKFCMACGAKLGDYSGSGVNIQDGFVQRSQVGAASVGNIKIAPVINQQASGIPTCSHCGNVLSDRNTRLMEKCFVCGADLCNTCRQHIKTHGNHGIVTIKGVISSAQLKREIMVCRSCYKLCPNCKKPSMDDYEGKVIFGGPIVDTKFEVKLFGRKCHECSYAWIVIDNVKLIQDDTNPKLCTYCLAKLRFGWFEGRVEYREWVSGASRYCICDNCGMKWERVSMGVPLRDAFEMSGCINLSKNKTIINDIVLKLKRKGYDTSAIENI